MHYQMRESGVARIMHILVHDYKLDLKGSEIEELAKGIQNLVSGAIIDASTTGNLSLSEACQNTLELVRKMIDNK